MPGLPVESFDRTSERYERFHSHAHGVMADEAVQATKREWASQLEASHGAVFADFPGEDAKTELFVDTLYVDWVISGLIEAVEKWFEITVSNVEPPESPSAPTLAAVRRRISRDRQPISEAVTEADLRAAGVEALRALYEEIIPRKYRLALGEYYTPRGVAELAVDSLEIDDAEASVLDPGCGSGVFLSVCLDRKLDAMAGSTPTEIIDTVTESVIGIDRNPVAVKTSTLSYLLALAPVLGAESVQTVDLPVVRADALGLGDAPATDALDFRVDSLVGNPPWITWDRLSEQLKSRLRERYVEQLGLCPHEGAAARLGHSNDDLSVPFVWICIHRYLAEGGEVSVVLKRDLLTGPAGSVFRDLRVGDRPLAPRQIHDFTGLQPFGGQVGADAAIYTMQADAAPSFPVETTAWTGGGAPDFSTRATIAESLRRTATSVSPLDPEDRTSAWIRADAERGALGRTAHEIRHGVKDDAEAVFGIDRAQLDGLEDDLIYPYLKSRHVVKYGLFGHDLRLVPVEKANEDNEATVRERYPATYEYLADHRDRLAERSSSWLDGGPFYNVFGVGPYTWAPYKVVWCRLGFKPHFAVVSTVDDPDVGEKPVVPGDHYMFIGTDDQQEAHALCALLNSAVYQKSLRDIASEGKSSLSKAVVSELELPRFGEIPRGERLAELSMQAHEIVPQYTDRSKRAYNQLTIEELSPIQAEIDRLVEECLVGGGGDSGR